MSIINSIETARNAKLNDDLILREVANQNPQKKSVFEQAVSRGANSTDILNEIINQNKNVNSSFLDRGIAEQQSDNIVKEAPVKKQGFLNKVGKFFTGSTQKFAETLGTAMSVIDPKTKKLRKEALGSTNQQVDDLMKIARESEDKERATRLLDAAQKLANTDDIDIFNNPEYQKTAKQILGEGAGVALETLGWGKVGGLTKGVKVATAGQTALRGATTGGILGAGFGSAQAMQDNKSNKEILRGGITGGVTGAITGGALGYVAGKIGGKISKKQATKLVSPELSKAERVSAAKAGRLKPRTFLRSEKYTPSAKDKELGKLAQEIGLKGKNAPKDITRASSEIEKEAIKLKKLLKGKGGVYNKNIIKGQLNKMKADVTTDLIEPEVRVYEKMIKQFNKFADGNKNKGLDGLLEVRQKFDKWAISNSKNIFNKENGSARALRAVRDTINDYINKQTGDDIVKLSLRKQSNLFSIIDNMAEKVASRSNQLQPSKLSRPLRKAAGWGVGLGTAYILGKRGGSSSGSGSVDISSFTE